MREAGHRPPSAETVNIDWVVDESASIVEQVQRLAMRLESTANVARGTLIRVRVTANKPRARLWERWRSRKRQHENEQRLRRCLAVGCTAVLAAGLSELRVEVEESGAGRISARA